MPIKDITLAISIVFIAAISAFAQFLPVNSAQASANISQSGAKPITVGETLRINSKRMNEEREVRVYFPSSYANTKQNYPVIYALDGEGDRKSVV